MFQAFYLEINHRIIRSMIEVKNVTKVYGKRTTSFTALDGVSFSIPEGSSVAIVGKSGSGKSTLMHAVSGLDKASSGEIIIDGDNILCMKPKQIDEFRSKKMSFIFQSFFVQGNESCYNNVALPLEIARVPHKERRAKVEKALAAVQLLDKAKSRARDLSGGQKQRLAVARAIVNEPGVLFADEPTGNLDSVTGQVVEDLLFAYAKDHNATLIIVTHDHELAAKCDIQIYIKDGKIEKVEQRKGVKTEQATAAKVPLSSRRRVVQ